MPLKLKLKLPPSDDPSTSLPPLQTVPQLPLAVPLTNGCELNVPPPPQDPPNPVTLPPIQSPAQPQQPLPVIVGGASAGKTTPSKKRKNPPAPNTHEPVGPGKSWRKGLKGNHNKSAKIEHYREPVLEADYRSLQQLRASSPGASSVMSSAHPTGPPLPPPVIPRLLPVTVPPKVTTTFITPVEIDFGKPQVRKFQKARRSWMSVSGFSLGAKVWAGLPVSMYADAKAAAAVTLAMENQMAPAFLVPGVADEYAMATAAASGSTSTTTGKGKGTKRKAPSKKSKASNNNSASGTPTATTPAMIPQVMHPNGAMYPPPPGVLLPYPPLPSHISLPPPQMIPGSSAQESFPATPHPHVAPIQGPYIPMGTQELDDGGVGVPVFLGKDGQPVPFGHPGHTQIFAPVPPGFVPPRGEKVSFGAGRA